MNCPICKKEVFQVGWKDKEKKIPDYFENFHGWAKIRHNCGVKV